MLSDQAPTQGASAPLHRVTRASIRSAPSIEQPQEDGRSPQSIDEADHTTCPVVEERAATKTVPVISKQSSVSVESGPEVCYLQPQEALSTKPLRPEECYTTMEPEKLTRSTPLPVLTNDIDSSWHQIYSRNWSPMFVQGSDDGSSISVKREDSGVEIASAVLWKDELSTRRNGVKNDHSIQFASIEFSKEQGAQMSSATRSNQRRKRLFHESGTFNLGFSAGTEDTSVCERDRERPIIRVKPTVSSLPTFEIDKTEQNKADSWSLSLDTINATMARDMDKIPDLESRTNKKFIFLAFETTSSTRIQMARSWLISKKVSGDQIFDTSVQRNWSQFKKKLPYGSCTIIFDKHFPIATLQGLARIIHEHDDLICWKLTYQNEDLEPLPMLRLFPSGYALAISEASFLNDPDSVLGILLWLKMYAESLHSRVLLFLPPIIIELVLSQAHMAKNCITKKSFHDLASLTEKLTSEALPPLTYDRDSESSPETRRFNLTVIQSQWNSVYQAMVEDETLSSIEWRQKDEEKERRLLSCFSTKTISYYLSDYRHFVAIAFYKQKLASSTHMRVSPPRAFLDSVSNFAERKQ